MLFIDDLQAVRRDAMANSTDVERLARECGADVYEHRLEASSAAAAPTASLRWVEQTMHICSTANQLWAAIRTSTSTLSTARLEA